MTSSDESCVRRQASLYHFEPEQADEDGGFDAEPFVVIKKVKGAKAAAKAD